MDLFFSKKGFNFYFLWTFDAGSIMPKQLRLELTFYLTDDLSNCTNICILNWIGLELATLCEDDTIYLAAQGKMPEKIFGLCAIQVPHMCITEDQEVCSSQ